MGKAAAPGQRILCILWLLNVRFLADHIKTAVSEEIALLSKILVHMIVYRT